MLDWTPADLQVWRVRMSFTQAKAAERLGISLRAYSDRETGKSSISRECVLACQMIERQHADIDADLGRLLQGDSETTREIRRLAREQRSQRVLIESLVETLARRELDVMNHFFQVFSTRANADMREDSPETRGYLYESAQGAMNRIRTNVMSKSI